jgi:hypothetical protein
MSSRPVVSKSGKFRVARHPPLILAMAAIIPSGAHGSALSERSGPVDSRLDPCRLWPGSPPRRHWQVGGLRAIFIHSSSLADHGAQTCRCPEGSKGDSARQTPGVRGVCLFESEYGVRSWYALRNRNSDWNTQ